MMLTPLGYVLVAVASAVLAAGSFWLGRRATKPQRPGGGGNLQQRYLAGFTQLLKERPDAATEAFVAALDVNVHTLETHIAFGEMLRRRGEVDKAIRVHQNAMSQPDLAPAGIERAQLALALDYKQAGLLDRAEVLLRELSGAQDRGLGIEALEALLEVLQQEREWPAAIDVAATLAGLKRGDESVRLKVLQAQFACEQAEVSRQQGSMQQYLHWSNEALRFSPKHPRPAINLARWDFAQGDYRAAVSRLKVALEFPSLLPEVMPILRAAYTAQGRQREYLELVGGLIERHRSGALLLEWSRLIAADDPTRAVAELQRHAAHTDDFAPLSALLNCLPADAVEPLSLIEALEPQQAPAFSCVHCGFSGQQVHWRCPTCNAWL